MIRYGLRHKATGKLLGVKEHTEYRSAWVVYTLSSKFSTPWLYLNKHNVEKVREMNDRGFTCSRTKHDPYHPFEAKELEVVTITLEIK